MAGLLTLISVFMVFATSPPDTQGLEQPGVVVETNSSGQVARVWVGEPATDAFLKKVSALPALKELYIGAPASLTAAGFAHLSRSPSLESLTVYAIPLPEGAVAHVVRLKALKNLSLNGCALQDKDLVGLHRAAGLRSLELDGNQVSNAGLAKLTSLVGLESLSVANTNWVDSGMRITDTGLVHLAKLTSLRELDLGDTQVSDHGFARLAALKNLRELKIDGTRVTGEGLKVLENYPGLESLTVGGRWMTDAGMQHLSHCQGLKRLSMSFAGVGDRGLKQVARLERLERLRLDSKIITDAGLAHLSSLKYLRHLELRASKVRDEGLRHISHIKSLARLDLSGSGISGSVIGRNFTSEGYSHLQGMKHLKIFSLANADVAWDELRMLTNVKVLQLLMTTMAKDDVHRLQDALPDTYVGASSGGWSVGPRQRSSEAVLPLK